MTGSLETLYVASRGDGELGGVVAFSVDPVSGALQQVAECWGVPAPRALAMHPSERVLYAAGGDAGAVVAIALSSTSMHQFSAQASGGSVPCSLVVDPSGRYLLTANYGSGTLALHTLEDDGGIGSLSAVLQHEGTGPVAERQEASHLHQVCFDDDGVNALVTDLGADAIYAYRLDARAGRIERAPVSRSCTPAGSGPRHLAFNGRDGVLVADELSSTVSGYRYAAQTGELTWRFSVAATGHTADVGNVVNYPSEIAVRPDRAVVFVANRGNDTIAAFKIRAEGLVRVAEVPAGARWPVHFVATHGRLYCAGAEDNRITVFAIDSTDAVLSIASAAASVPSPMWLLSVQHSF